MHKTQFIENAWALDIDNILATLETNKEGLSEIEALNRLHTYGKNTFQNKEQKRITLILSN